MRNNKLIMTLAQLNLFEFSACNDWLETFSPNLRTQIKRICGSPYTTFFIKMSIPFSFMETSYFPLNVFAFMSPSHTLEISTVLLWSGNFLEREFKCVKAKTYSGMSTIVVIPPDAAACVAVANPSQSVLPGSLTWTWLSTTPGITTRSPASKTCEEMLF